MADYLFSVNQSVEFFGALRSASVEVFKHFGLPLSEGSKHYSSWEHGRPIGGMEHYTAGVTWKGTVSWLNDGGNNNSVSCQFLVLDHMPPEVKEIFDRYEELKDLKVAAFELSDGIVPCWQAGWVNKLTVGIENRNAGILRGSNGDWRWWANNWTAKFPHETLGKTPILIDGQWWEPYTRGQIAANILIYQHLHCQYQEYGGLDHRWILPHSATSNAKWDTGRAYPMRNVRKAIIDQVPIDQLYWLGAFEQDPVGAAVALEDEEDEDFLNQLEMRQTDRMEGEYDWAEIQSMPSPDLQQLVQDGEWRQELDAVRRALEKLWYVTGGSGPELDEDTALAVYQFQRSADLKADKIPGTFTQNALYKRLVDFRLT